MVPLSNDKKRYGSVGTDSSERLDSNPLIQKDAVEEYKNGNDIDENDAVRNYCATYFCSWRFVELIVCSVPVAIWLWFENGDVKPNMRPIPFQEVLAYNGEPLGGDKPNIVWSAVNSDKYNGSTVGHIESEFLNGFCPLVLQIILVWYHAPIFASVSDRLDTLHRTICMYFVALGTSDTICNCTKFYIGYLRPVFLDMCKPYYDEDDSTFYCSHEKNNARVSFPSNHAVWAFCGQLLLSMYLSQRYGLPSIMKNGANFNKKTTGSKFDRLSYYRIISYLCYAPILFSYFVAASRLYDKKHFPADVMAGGIIGGTMAFMTFGYWFPQ